VGVIKMGYTPQFEKLKMDRNILLGLLGKSINVEFDDGCFIGGKLQRFERVGEAKHKPFVLVLLLPNGERIITKWMGIIHWK
jgi:hypothetical protein